MSLKTKFQGCALILLMFATGLSRAEDPGEMFAGLQDKEQTSGAFDLQNWDKTSAAVKPVFVKAIMEQAGRHEIQFSHSADWYLEQLNALSSFSRSHNYQHFLKTPLARNLANIAVLNCDWANGAEPRQFAYTYLGKEQLQQLGQLYPQGLAELEAGCPGQAPAAAANISGDTAASQAISSGAP